MCVPDGAHDFFAIFAMEDLEGLPWLYAWFDETASAHNYIPSAEKPHDCWRTAAAVFLDQFLLAIRVSYKSGAET